MTPGDQNDVESTLHDRVGGKPFFDSLVGRFYEGVETDPVLRPIYPEDLEPGKGYLAGFLTQYWGGPPNYSLERGHPRLRMRHFKFTINQTVRDAWLGHMLIAVQSSDASPKDKALMSLYFEQTATFLMNSEEG